MSCVVSLKADSSRKRTISSVYIADHTCKTYYYKFSGVRANTCKDNSVKCVDVNTSITFDWKALVKLVALSGVCVHNSETFCDSNIVLDWLDYMDFIET